MRGCVREASNSAIGSLRQAFCRTSPNSRAESNRVHGCLAIALWTTRLIICVTAGFRSEAGGGIVDRIAWMTASSVAARNG
jgi:hypothetical protein